MIYQELSVLLDASIAENIFVGHLPCKHGLVNYKKLYADTEASLKTIRLDVSPKMNARKLNSGQLQMVSLMRAFKKTPKIYREYCICRIYCPKTSVAKKA